MAINVRITPANAANKRLFGGSFLPKLGTFGPWTLQSVRDVNRATPRVAQRSSVVPNAAIFMPLPSPRFFAGVVLAALPPRIRVGETCLWEGQVKAATANAALNPKKTHNGVIWRSHAPGK